MSDSKILSKETRRGIRRRVAEFASRAHRMDASALLDHADAMDEEIARLRAEMDEALDEVGRSHDREEDIREAWEWWLDEYGQFQLYRDIKTWHVTVYALGVDPPDRIHIGQGPTRIDAILAAHDAHQKEENDGD